MRLVRTLVGALVAVLPIGAIVAPSPSLDAAPIVVALPTTYVAPWNHAGGTGDVRASWRNDGAQIDSFGVTAEAPPGQMFRRSGLMTLYVLDPSTGVWNIDGQPRVETECTVSPGGADIECAHLTVDLPPASSLAVSIPTFVAPGAPVTGAASIEPGTLARLHLGTSTWDSLEATAVASSDPVHQSTEFPAMGARVVRGEANPGTVVTIESASGDELGSARAGAQGRWDITLPPGFGPIQAVFDTLDGVRSTLPAGYYNSYLFTLGSPADDAAWITGQVLSGTGQPGSAVVVRTSDGVQLTEVRADASGTWTLALPESLAPGEHELVVIDTISDGTSASIPLRGRLPASDPPLPAEPEVAPSPGPPTAPRTPTPAVRMDVSVSTGRAIADGEDVRVVRVVVSDGSGAPLAGQWVRFEAPSGLALTATTALTDVRGTATTTVAADQAIATTLTVESHGIAATTPELRFDADADAVR